MNRQSLRSCLGIAALWLISPMANLAAADIERPETQPVSGKIKWVYDYEEGKKLARQDGRPLMVVFRCER